MNCGMVKPLPIMSVTKFGYELTMKSKYLINLLYLWLHIKNQIFKFGEKKNPALLEIETFQKLFIYLFNII
jgi:hypothetical protein